VASIVAQGIPYMSCAVAVVMEEGVNGERNWCSDASKGVLHIIISINPKMVSDLMNGRRIIFDCVVLHGFSLTCSSMDNGIGVSIPCVAPHQQNSM